MNMDTRLEFFMVSFWSSLWLSLTAPYSKKLHKEAVEMVLAETKESSVLSGGDKRTGQR